MKKAKKKKPTQNSKRKQKPKQRQQQIKAKSSRAKTKKTKEHRATMPPEAEGSLNFSVLVMSFAASALHALGQDLQSDNPDLVSGPTQPHLARLNIDLLMLLQNKTAGNLSKEEADFLSAVIYDLQQRFLRLS